MQHTSLRVDPWVGKDPGRREWLPAAVSVEPENPHGQSIASWRIQSMGLKELDMTSTQAWFHLKEYILRFIETWNQIQNIDSLGIPWWPSW